MAAKILMAGSIMMDLILQMPRVPTQVRVFSEHPTPLPEAARYASAAAAISVQSLGAQPSLPMKDAIDAFYEQRK